MMKMLGTVFILVWNFDYLITVTSWLGLWLSYFLIRTDFTIVKFAKILSKHGWFYFNGRDSRKFEAKSAQRQLQTTSDAPKHNENFQNKIWQTFTEPMQDNSTYKTAIEWLVKFTLKIQILPNNIPEWLHPGYQKFQVSISQTNSFVTCIKCLCVK